MKSFKLYIISILSLLTLALPVRAKEETAKFTVVVDAGHGGKDYGAIDNGAKEKDINLGVAKQLESLIKKKLKEAKVVMTRDNDTYLTLQERADKANKAKGNLFISIHTNSVDKSNKNRKTVSGSSVYALGLHKDDNNMRVAQRENSVIELENNFEQKYSGFDPMKDESYIIFEMAQKKNLSNSIRFAESVQKELVKSGRGNRGVHQAGFWVLWATSMPAVLVELDFICNPGSAEYMTSDKGQKELAQAIFNAVEKYCDSWLGSGGTVSGNARVEGNSSLSAGDDAPAVAMALASTEKKSKVSSPAGKTSNRSDYAAARRRRRSESGKAISETRNYETSSIPLHSESERVGTLVSVVAEQSAADDASSLSKTSEKENKKKKKEKEKKQKKENEEKKKRNSKSHNAKIEKFVTVYKIQILASADLLKQNNPRFCGLTPISTYKENNLYKYYYGESADKAEIDALLKDVRKKIPDAFIVSSTKSVGAAKN